MKVLDDQTQPPLARFANHRSVTPMLWAFVALAVCELLVVHLLLSLLWPIAAWPLSVLTAISIIWLVSWILSWARLPHELYPDRLIVHMGLLRSVEIPLEAIGCIETEVTSLKLNAGNVRNMVPIAFPNRLIWLNRPLKGSSPIFGLAIKVDDPTSFDAAMQNIGK